MQTRLVYDVKCKQTLPWFELLSPFLMMITIAPLTLVGNYSKRKTILNSNCCCFVVIPTQGKGFGNKSQEQIWSQSSWHCLIFSSFSDSFHNDAGAKLHWLSSFPCARGVVVIVVGNGHGNTSSNPGWDWLHFT